MRLKTTSTKVGLREARPETARTGKVGVEKLSEKAEVAPKSGKSMNMKTVKAIEAAAVTAQTIGRTASSQKVHSKMSISVTTTLGAMSEWRSSGGSGCEVTGVF